MTFSCFNCNFGIERIGAQAAGFMKLRTTISMFIERMEEEYAASVMHRKV